MSYDVTTYCDHCDSDLDTWNMTSNVSPMWRAAGVDLALWDGAYAGACAEELKAAIANLEADPERFRAMDSPNGWGTYAHLLPAFRELLQKLEAHPKALVRISC